MRGRNDGTQSKRPVVLFCLMVVCLCLLFLYFSGSKGQAGSTALEYGTKFSRSLGWGSDVDGDDGSDESIFGTGDANDVKLKSFPVCDDPDSVWGVTMEACITSYPEQMHRDGGSGLAPWPARLTTPPPRLADLYVTADTFEKDTEMWQQRVDNYWNLLRPKIKPDTIRNVMDMKANFGSFAAALKEKNVWVMNAVPHDGPSTLKIIYDRGLIGSIHDWCEAFSTYPRTYDLLHAWTVFSDLDKRGCSAEDLLLEMDRILRPTGFIIVRDKAPVILFIKKYLNALHWEAVTVVDAESSPEQEDNEMIFIIRKKLWLPEGGSQDST